jgi:hypothetical protein
MVVAKKKNRHIDQQARIESKINSRARNTHWGKDGLVHQWCWEIQASTSRGMKVTLTNITQKSTQNGLKLKCKTRSHKILRRKPRRKATYNIVLDNDFFGLDHKNTGTPKQK